VIFNLFLFAVTMDGFPPDAGVPFIYRLDVVWCGLYNIRRLTAETNVSRDRVFELQYADDAALPVKAV